MLELVAEFGKTHSPLRTYVSAVSEGGLVAALLAERSPDVFFGALAACGPIGSFNAQIDYIGNFRVLFDYFFPGVIPGSAIDDPAGRRGELVLDLRARDHRGAGGQSGPCRRIVARGESPV